MNSNVCLGVCWYEFLYTKINMNGVDMPIIEKKVCSCDQSWECMLNKIIATPYIGSRLHERKCYVEIISAHFTVEVVQRAFSGA